MSSIPVQHAGASAFETARRGLDRSAELLDASAEEVFEATRAALNAASGVEDTVSLSAEALAAGGGASIENGLISGRVAQLSYAANARTVRTADDQFRTMLDMVAPRRDG